MTGVVRTVAADDAVALHVECEGAGPGLDETPTVLFTHGFTGATSTWDRQRELLRDRVPVAVWDGEGPDERTTTAVQEQVEHLRLTVAAGLWSALLAPDRAVAWDALRGMPVTVVGGCDDEVTPIRHGRRIRELLDGGVDLVSVPGAGHDVVHTHHADVDAALLRLLARGGALGA